MIYGPTMSGTILAPVLGLADDPQSIACPS